VAAEVRRSIGNAVTSVAKGLLLQGLEKLLDTNRRRPVLGGYDGAVPDGEYLYFPLGLPEVLAILT
jgi:hypothetical protein